jgi:hypothetical protein
MSHVLHYDGQYFRVDITEVMSPDEPGQPAYVGWYSDAFRDLKDMPSHPLSRLVVGPPLPKHAEALQHAHEFIKKDWDTQKAKRGIKAANRPGVIYTVSLFKVDSSLKCEFDEFADAKAFAKAAEKSADLKKIGITNNESPQYLTLWEKE